MLRGSAVMALLFAATLAGFETWINWGQWQWWPWWLVDYCAAALLAAGGIMALRAHASGPLVLCCGWGFALGMMWMSLAGNVEAGTDPARAARVAELYILLIGLAMAWSLAGLILTFAGRRA